MLEKTKALFYRIKWEISNIRRHWKLFGLLVIMSVLVYRMFVSNYVLVWPVQKIDEYRTAIQDHNDLVACETWVKELQDARDQINADIMGGITIGHTNDTDLR